MAKMGVTGIKSPPSKSLRRTIDPPLFVATFVAASRSRGRHLARGWQVGTDLVGPFRDACVAQSTRITG